MNIVAWDVQCVRKVAVRLWKVLEVMSTNIYTSQNPFYSQTNLPVSHFNRRLTAEYSEMSHNSSTIQRQLSILTTKSTYLSPSAQQRLSERIVECTVPCKQSAINHWLDRMEEDVDMKWVIKVSK
jgi:hypothetical protein